MISRINLDMKLLRERSAGNPHATFDVAGTGNRMHNIRAPVLDPTCVQQMRIHQVGVNPTDAIVKAS